MQEKIPRLDFGGKGPLLHFAHANAYTPGCYRHFLAHLTAEFQVVALKQRPLWPGQAPAQLSRWDLFADDLLAFFEQEGWG